VTWAQIARLAVELGIDLVRGKLEKKPKPARGLPFRDVEIQVNAARMAGHEPPPPSTVRSSVRTR
jgi:hypothetical protein